MTRTMSTLNTDLKERIGKANAEVVRRLVDARPFLIDMAPAKDVVPGLGGGRRRVHHSGPPIELARMCGAQKGAIVCAALAEGWAQTPAEAFQLLEAGDIELGCNHEHQSVGPMAGIVSPNTWVYVVENRTANNVSFAPEQQARATFGAYDDAIAVQERRTSSGIIGPTLRKALKHTGPLDLGELMAQSLHMGDELHNRVTAASCLLLRALLPGLVKVGGAEVLKTIEYINEQSVFFLAVSMAAAKSMSDAAADVPESTLVTTMCRNGTDFGIRIAGLKGRWFCGPAQKVRGPYMPGFGDDDAGLDMGDSAVTEVIGVGGCAMSAAPAISSFVGGTAKDLLDSVPKMRQICTGRNPKFTIPILDFEPTPVGIDIRKVVKTGILPIINTAIAHKDAGHQILGAGIVHPPLSCFADALRAFGAHYLPPRS